MRRERFKFAGLTVKVKEDIEFYGGKMFEIEDYWENVYGKSWMYSDGIPAAMAYAIRTGRRKGKVPTDDEVVYGKIGWAGHLFHVSELELPETDVRARIMEGQDMPERIKEAMRKMGEHAKRYPQYRVEIAANERMAGVIIIVTTDVVISGRPVRVRISVSREEIAASGDKPENVMIYELEKLIRKIEKYKQELSELR